MLMDVVHVAAIWLHALAMVIVLGYYAILSRIVLPAVARALDGPALARAVPAVERRALPLVVIAIVVFIATGVYLLAIDGRYGGLGAFTATTWSMLMLVKHVVVGVMVVLGIGIDRLAAAVGDASDAGRGRTFELLVLTTDGMTVLGAIVLLLTAAAQLS
jgi:uncharacterized membrane protein